MSITDVVEKGAHLAEVKHLASRHIDSLDPVETAKAIEEATWTFADSIIAYTPPDEYGDAANGVNTGVRAALDDLEEQLHHEYSARTLRYYRATALAWEGAHRWAPSQASFVAHLELRGREDRVAIMRKLVDKHGYVSKRIVERWRATQRGYVAERSWIASWRSSAHNLAVKAETPEARHEAADALVDELAETWGCRVRIDWPDES